MNNKDIVIIIPVFRHVNEFQKILDSLISFNLPLIVVDDGNDAKDRSILESLQDKYNFTLCHHQENKGKGGSVYTGLEEASRLGFSHALQIDADGQHEIGDIRKFLDAHYKFPDKLILGAPIFDNKAPKSRVYGRMITNYLVKFETMNFNLVDALFGFRIYPVSLTLNLYPRNKIRERMGFDVEVLVRLLWHGCDVVTIYTPVYYPEGGVSNFNYLKDNLSMILMHIEILFKSPFRILLRVLGFNKS